MNIEEIMKKLHTDVSGKWIAYDDVEKILNVLLTNNMKYSNDYAVSISTDFTEIKREFSVGLDK